MLSTTIELSITPGVTLPLTVTEGGVSVAVQAAAPVSIPLSVVGASSAITVIDNLLSDSATAALAARQGKALALEDALIREAQGDDTDFAALFNSLLS